MADKRDFYDVLGVGKNASDDEIKKAYRKLARQYHPDFHPGDSSAEAKYKEVNEAYDVLSDASKKQRYDQFGHAGVDPSYAGAGGGGGFGGFGGFEGGGIDFGDLFEGIFGGFGGGRSASVNAPKRGQDLSARVDITFEEACFGVKKEVKLNKIETCHDCGGSGARKGSDSETCSECRGTGVIRQATRMGPISLNQTMECPKCRGRGKIIKEPCPTCRADGKIKVQKVVTVGIPAGIDNGQVIKVEGEGNHGSNGGPKGSLMVSVYVKPDKLFKRDGFDIHIDFPITYVQAVQGAKLTVPTIDGKVEYDISAGAQNGATFRLRGKGIKKLHRNDRGDEYVTIFVEVPKNLSKKQLELLKEFENSMTEENYQKRKGFFATMKEKFGS
jgi:molecular chaperone DnaJ